MVFEPRESYSIAQLADLAETIRELAEELNKAFDRDHEVVNPDLYVEKLRRIEEDARRAAEQLEEAAAAAEERIQVWEEETRSGGDGE